MASASSSLARSPPLLIQPQQLSLFIKNEADKRPIYGSGLRILDASWHMPNAQPPRNAQQEFREKPRIPGAQFWNVDEVATTGESVRNLPHMMPDEETFAKAAGEHGISNDSHVVVYDSHGVFSAPRTAFTFLAFGHPNVSILDGGLPGWIDAGFPLEEGTPKTVEKTQYQSSKLVDGLVRSYDEMVANARMTPARGGQTVLDARSRGRFDGTEPEPRPGLSSGHIPHSLSLPFPTLLNVHTAKDPRLPAGTKYTKLKEQTQLWRTISDAVGGMEALDKLRQASSGGESAVTATCGSGMTAAAIWLALKQLGIQTSIYDESWMGYASRQESPIDKKE